MILGSHKNSYLTLTDSKKNSNKFQKDKLVINIVLISKPPHHTESILHTTELNHIGQIAVKVTQKRAHTAKLSSGILQMNSTAYKQYGTYRALRAAHFHPELSSSATVP